MTGKVDAALSAVAVWFENLKVGKILPCCRWIQAEGRAEWLIDGRTIHILAATAQPWQGTTFVLGMNLEQSSNELVSARLPRDTNIPPLCHTPQVVVSKRCMSYSLGVRRRGPDGRWAVVGVCEAILKCVVKCGLLRNYELDKLRFFLDHWRRKMSKSCKGSSKAVFDKVCDIFSELIHDDSFHTKHTSHISCTHGCS